MLSRPLLSLTPRFALKYNANKQVANSAGFQFEELYDPTWFCCPNIVVVVVAVLFGRNFQTKNRSLRLAPAHLLRGLFYSDMTQFYLKRDIFWSLKRKVVIAAFFTIDNKNFDFLKIIISYFPSLVSSKRRMELDISSNKLRLLYLLVQEQ